MTPTSDKTERLAPERPDDSGIYDDETLESIIRESVDHITDPVTRRDMRWLIARLDARVPAEQRVEREILCTQRLSDSLPCGGLASDRFHKSGDRHYDHDFVSEEKKAE